MNWIKKINGLAWIALIVVMSSCNNQYAKFSRSFNGKKEDGQNFVVTKDSVKIESDEVKKKTPFFSKSVVQLNDGTKIPVKNIVAYQNETGYYARLDNAGGGLIKRVHKGNIDVYQRISYTYEPPTYTTNAIGMSRWSNSRQRTEYDYYLKKGINGQAVYVKPGNAKLIYDLVADYAPSEELMGLFIKKRKQLKAITIINIAAGVGGLFLVATSEGTASGEVGSAMILGSFVSGAVNLFRRIRNQHRMFGAINEYNLRR